jgi:hypothetical protein
LRKNISIFCLVIAWLCANGAVWNVVQVVAWSKMYLDYARVLPARIALSKTFDPSKPCELCKVVRHAEESARGQLPRDAELKGGVEKVHLIAEGEPDSVLAAPTLAWPHSGNQAGIERTGRVPLPPPRV